MSRLFFGVAIRAGLDSGQTAEKTSRISLAQKSKVLRTEVAPYRDMQ